MKLAVYTICKNEIKFVDTFMRSVLEADYVVVLDTGSTDGCYEKLLEYQRKYPEKVIVSQKVYDNFRFDVARNDNLDMCPDDTDIYISIDLDEVMTPAGWVNKIKEKWIPGHTQRASYLYTWSFTKSGKPGRIFWYNKAHNKDWRWKHPVHELLASTITGSEHYDGSVSVRIDGIMLEHHPDKTKSRGSYLSLLRLRKEENPDDSYGLIYLCHELHYRGLYEESIEELKGALEKFSDHYNEIEKGSCYLFMGDNYRCLNRETEAIECYKQAINIIPSYREPYLNLAKVYLDLKQFETAKYTILESLQKSFRHYSWLERDTSWSWEPYDLLDLACYYSGDYTGAAAYAAKALDLEPGSKRLKENLRLCLEKI